MNKDVQQLLKKLRSQGFRTRFGGSGHYRVTSPDGRTVTMAATPRSSSLIKARADLRRIGARL